MCCFGTPCLFLLYRSCEQEEKWNKTVMVFMQVRVWLKRSLGPSEGGGMGRGCVQVEKPALEGKSPKGRLVVRQGCMGEMVPRLSEEEEEQWDGSNLTTVF